nr:Zinc finger protein jing protein [Hymenolepis microstoma]
MSPALRDPVRTLSRSSLRLIPNKISAILCDIDRQSIARSEASLDGSLASLARTPSHDSNLCGDTPNSSPGNEPSPLKRPSVAASIASSATDHSQVFAKFCQWSGCNCTSDIASGSLLSHIQETHVSPQIDSKSSTFVCLWKGCKVYGQHSVSSNWLVRHVQEHSEAKGKPFSCMFSDCCQRFSSSSLLQRHIDRDHTRSKVPKSAFNKSPTQSRSLSSRKFPDGYKKRKRNVYKSNQNIRKCPVRHPDYVDNLTKVALQNRLYLDEILARKDVIEKITRDFDDEPILPCTLRNGKRRDQTTPEKRILRSTSMSTTPDNDSQMSDEVNPEHVRLIMTNPYIFVGQRLNADNRTEILVEWHGHLSNELPPTMWVLVDEIKAANNLDELCYLHPTLPSFL